MGLLDFIFNLPTGGLERGEPVEEPSPPSSWATVAVEASGECNNCGRTFHAVWINCPCPAPCGGRIYSK